MSDIRRSYKRPDSWWGFLIMSRLSGRLLWLLANFTRFPPEVVTVGSFLVGLGAIPFFLQGTPKGIFIGGLFALLSDILDGTNGKMARLYGVANAMGGYLDTLFDIIKISLYLIVIPIGQYYQTGDIRFLVLATLLLLVFNLRMSNENLLGRIRMGLPYTPKTVQNGSKKGNISGYSRFMKEKGILPMPGGSELNAMMFIIGPLTGQTLPLLILGGIGFVILSMGYTIRTMLQTRGLTQGIEKDHKPAPEPDAALS